MRVSIRAAIGVGLMLALAGCGSGPKTGISALEAPAGDADRLTVEQVGYLDIQADSVRLLAEEGGHAFYAAVPENESGTGVCLVVVELQSGKASSGCGGALAASPLGLGAFGLDALLVADDHDAGDDLARGWEQVHPNLLVRDL